MEILTLSASGSRMGNLDFNLPCGGNKLHSHFSTRVVSAKIEWGTWTCTPPVAVRWCEAVICYHHQGGVSESWGRIFYPLPSVRRLFFAFFTSGVLLVETNVFHPPHGVVWSAVRVGSAEAKKRTWKLSPAWQHQGSFSLLLAEIMLVEGRDEWRVYTFTLYLVTVRQCDAVYLCSHSEAMSMGVTKEANFPLLYQQQWGNASILHRVLLSVEAKEGILFPMSSGGRWFFFPQTRVW